MHRLAAALLPFTLLGALAGSAVAQEPKPVPAEPVPKVIDPAAAVDTPPLFVADAELERLAEQDLNAARPLLRRAARSAPAFTTRALALRLLASHDASSATARICGRSLRIDPDGLVRRSAAECLGRLGAELGGGQTPALVAALSDGNLDVMTMAGWALANVGEASALGEVAARMKHEDPRVARLFVGYAERMTARLGLDYRPKTAESPRDAEGRRLVPGGLALTTQASGLDMAASTAWLGLYGGITGWYHGAFLLSAHGGTAGAQAAALGGLGGAALGAAAASTYAFTRADSVPLAHTVVQLGTFGTLAGFGAGMLTGAPPSAGVAAANLSAVGTLAGTALGVALVETAPPTLGALGAGVVAGLATATATGALAASYEQSGFGSAGAGLFCGSLAGAGTTLALRDLDVGLFPLAGAAVGSMAGAGGAGAVFALAEAGNPSEAQGWGVLAGTAVGAALGAAGGLALPKEWDPLLARDLEILPPTVSLLGTPDGKVVPGVLLAGRF
ncbi:MAG: HEAT repeat domain-containing protein [Deltaproteobacteria bacterium]|nr:HEAT repeat domain-containing protein [Deltaproteobacteria bacterium]